jgi:chromosome segregation ATPase
MEKESLAQANSSLNVELEVHQNKLNELQLALAAAVAEKEGASEEIHSLRKTLDGMIERKAELEIQVSSTMEEHDELKSKYQNALEEKQILNDKYETTKKELEEAIAKLEEKMNVDKSEKELHISKLERQITLSEIKYMEEIKTMQVETTEKDEALTARMQEHANLQHEKDELEQQLLEIRKELDGAYRTIANQEEQASVREIKWDAYRKYSEDQLEAEQQRAAELELQVSALKQQLQEAEIHYKQKEEQVSLRAVQWEADKSHSLDELEAQRQYANDLEKQIEALTQKLQSVDAHYKQKVTEERDKLAEVTTEFNKLTQKVSKSVELEKKVQDLEQKLKVAYSKSEEQAKDSVQLRSREFTMDSSTISSKQHDRSLANDTTSPNPSQKEVQEPSGIMAFKFILGVALLSILIGVFLGKRY